MIERTRRNPQATVSMLLGYTVSAVSLVFGLLLVTGWLLSVRMPDQFRITFGVVLLLMGIYRFVLTRTKVRQWASEKDDTPE